MAQAGVSVQLNFAREITRATAAIQATPDQLQKASDRAIKKTIRWLKTRIAREISAATKVPQKALKPRLTTSVVGTGRDRVHILWFGSLPLAAENAGNPRQTRKGTSVGKHRYEGAFVATIYNPEANVWIRSRRNASAGHFTMGKPRKPSSGAGVPPELSGRFPVQRVGIPLDTLAAEVFKRYQRRAEARFGELIEQELNYAVNHENQR
ncbi:phage tail protein [Halomonas sp. OfavH-34-E]|uniref:phage tail protein n=1 Tax=Halomonas sp. OfavH-34-E TaxID=2954491 RepID=UPI0020969ACC|nr:phage tail protein [Halomonas sp. OfavH-34-E]MCO7217132.1 phage tail protein [Halomonas sp. OfavH-34-E]